VTQPKPIAALQPGTKQCNPGIAADNNQAGI
jgi:hypothetical protein